jgi:hypothetical protein
MLRIEEMNVMKPMTPLRSNDMGLARRRMDPTSATTGERKKREAKSKRSRMERGAEMFDQFIEAMIGRVVARPQDPVASPATVVSLRTRPIPLQLACTETKIPSRDSSFLTRKED